MTQKQLSDSTELVRFANEDIPTLIQIVGLNISELAHCFFKILPRSTLSRGFVEHYLHVHCSI